MSVRSFYTTSALASLALMSASAHAIDMSGLTVDLTGVDTAAIAIGTSIMGVLGVFWGVRKITRLLG